MKTVITLVCCACSSLLLAQGWNKIYTPGSPNEILEIADEQYLCLYNDTSLMLINHLGDTLWNKHFEDTYRDIRIANDSQLLRFNAAYLSNNNIVAEIELTNFGGITQIAHSSTDSLILWEKIAYSKDTALVLAGRNFQEEERVIIQKRKLDGEVLWTKNFNPVFQNMCGAYDYWIQDLLVNEENEIHLIGAYDEYCAVSNERIYLGFALSLRTETGEAIDIYADEYTPDTGDPFNGINSISFGDNNQTTVQGTRLLSLGTGPTWRQETLDRITEPSGTLITEAYRDWYNLNYVTGSRIHHAIWTNENQLVQVYHYQNRVWVPNEEGSISVDGFIFQDSLHGHYIQSDNWSRLLYAGDENQFEPGTESSRKIIKTTDDGILIAASNNGQINLLKVDAMGNFHPQRVKGKVYRDQNQNCTWEVAEMTVDTGWVGVFSLYDEMLYSTRIANNGNFEISLHPGDYQLKFFGPGQNSSACTVQGITVQSLDTLNVDIPTFLSVVDTTYLAACDTYFDSTHQVTYTEDVFLQDTTFENGIAFIENEFIQINASASVNIDTTLLEGALFRNTPIFNDTLIVDMLQTQTGCDSIVNYHIAVELTSLAAVNQAEAKVFPNPSRAVFNIQLPENLEHAANIEMRNIYGQKLGNISIEEATANQFSIDLSGQPSGTYLLYLIQNDEKLFLQKLLKSN